MYLIYISHAHTHFFHLTEHPKKAVTTISRAFSILSAHRCLTDSIYYNVKGIKGIIEHLAVRLRCKRRNPAAAAAARAMRVM